jgi:hypothetical protein
MLDTDWTPSIDWSESNCPEMNRSPLLKRNLANDLPILRLGSSVEFRTSIQKERRRPKAASTPVDPSRYGTRKSQWALNPGNMAVVACEPFDDPT